MEMIYKAARLEKETAGALELAMINEQTLRELTEDEVFTFRLTACDNQVDREGERFTEATLEQLGELYIGKPVLRDHNWSAETQTARVYDAHLEKRGDIKRLVLSCYMVRTASTADTIAAIEGGILRECSVGCAVEHVNCSICGADQRKTLCEHWPGREYDGQLCHFDYECRSPLDAAPPRLRRQGHEPQGRLLRRRQQKLAGRLRHSRRPIHQRPVLRSEPDGQ